MAGEDAQTVTKLSPRSVTSTVSRLTSVVTGNGMKAFAVIEQSAEASRAGLQLCDTTLVVSGSPAAGTPVMVAAPPAARDLPLKVLIWDDSERTKVTYYGPVSRATRYDLPADLAARLCGINPLIAPWAGPGSPARTAKRGLSCGSPRRWWP